MFPTAKLRTIAKEVQDFEAEPSKPRTGTGSRREGSAFEHLLAKFWNAVGEHLESQGADGVTVSNPSARRAGGRRWRRLTMGDRSVYLPTVSSGEFVSDEAPRTWLDLRFAVDNLVSQYPGLEVAVDRYAPDMGRYANEAYPAQFTGLETTFDDTIVLEDNGVLHEKVLLEYKTAKSIKGQRRSLEGNAHERLSFQVMQYLEIATRYPQCSLYVIANSAFARYRNKYHVNFRIQADRLAAFRWFKMHHLCTMSEYHRLVDHVTRWLLVPK